MSCDFVDITIDSDGIHIDIEWQQLTCQYAKNQKMGGLNMSIVLILEALAEAAVEFYVAKEAIDTLTNKKGK